MATRGGWRVLKYYASLEEMLKAVYPNVSWDSSRFLDAPKVPNGYWKKHENLIKALDRAEDKLGISQVLPYRSLTHSPFALTPLSLQQVEDWYAVSLSDLKQQIGFPDSFSRTQLVELLKEKNPQHTQWDNVLKTRGIQQRRLETAIRSLFPVSMIILFEFYYLFYLYFCGLKLYSIPRTRRY